MAMTKKSHAQSGLVYMLQFAVAVSRSTDKTELVENMEEIKDKLVYDGNLVGNLAGEISNTIDKFMGEEEVQNWYPENSEIVDNLKEVYKARIKKLAKKY